MTDTPAPLPGEGMPSIHPTPIPPLRRVGAARKSTPVTYHSISRAVLFRGTLTPERETSHGTCSPHLSRSVEDELRATDSASGVVIESLAAEVLIFAPSRNGRSWSGGMTG